MSWKKGILYLFFGVLMFGVLAEKVIRAEWTLQYGTQFRCPVTGFDPPDFLRGRYVRFQTEPITVRKGKDVGYVMLSSGPDGMVKYGEVLNEAPQIGDYMKLRRRNRWAPFQLPFDAFYVNERRANAVEKALRKHGKGILTFRVMNGFAVLEDLTIDGVSVRNMK